MSLKRNLRNTVMALTIIGCATPSYAFWTPACVWLGVCSWWDVLQLAAKAWGITASKKLMTTEISALEGLQPILDNIGQGNGPGISATGNTGADLTSDEEGAQMQAEQAMNAMVVPDVLVKLIEDPVTDKDGKTFLHLREQNLHQLLSDYCFKCATESAKDKGKCVVYQEVDCTEKQKEQINAGCDACNEHDAKDNKKCVSYDADECARERQNEWLMVAVDGAIGSVDAASDKKMARKYLDDIKALLQHAGKTGTVAGFWSDVQNMSVLGSAIVPSVTYEYAMDLMSTGIRAVSEEGVNLEVLPVTQPTTPSTGNGGTN